MKITLKLFDDCSDFDRDNEMELPDAEKKLCWSLCVDGEDLGLFTYGQELITVLEVLMNIDEKFDITKKIPPVIFKNCTQKLITTKK